MQTSLRCRLQNYIINNDYIASDEPKKGNKMIDIYSVLTEKCATFMFVFLLLLLLLLLF